MPLYEYRCLSCGGCFEELVSSGQATLPACPVCSSPQVERMLSNVCGLASGKSALEGFGSGPAASGLGGGCGSGGFS